LLGQRDSISEKGKVSKEEGEKVLKGIQTHLCLSGSKKKSLVRYIIERKAVKSRMRKGEVPRENY